MPRPGRISITFLLSVLSLTAIFLGSCLVISRQLDSYNSEQVQPYKMKALQETPPKPMTVAGRPTPTQSRSQTEGSEEWVAGR